jgi:Peptidase propeptide and YPEB domain
MKFNRRVLTVAAAIGALAAGGVGIASAVGGGEGEEQVTGPDADRAERAALDAVGGGSVTEIEYQESGGAGVYEVEVKRDDGSQVEVHLDADFSSVGTAADDDGPGDDDAGEAGEDG